MAAGQLRKWISGTGLAWARAWAGSMAAAASANTNRRIILSPVTYLPIDRQ